MSLRFVGRTLERRRDGVTKVVACCGFETPSAALHGVTEANGPYRWWGVVFGWVFIGVMTCAKREPREMPTRTDDL